jgi:hypothetical protein
MKVVKGDRLIFIEYDYEYLGNSTAAKQITNTKTVSLEHAQHKWGLVKRLTSAEPMYTNYDNICKLKL